MGNPSKFHNRKRWFAGIVLAAGIVLFLFSGFSGLAIVGILICVTGFIDFLVSGLTLEGRIASEVYGDPGEELWELRSYVMLVGGPLLILFSILFR